MYASIDALSTVVILSISRYSMITGGRQALKSNIWLMAENFKVQNIPWVFLIPQHKYKPYESLQWMCFPSVQTLFFYPLHYLSSVQVQFHSSFHPVTTKYNVKVR